MFPLWKREFENRKNILAYNSIFMKFVKAGKQGVRPSSSDVAAIVHFLLDLTLIKAGKNTYFLYTTKFLIKPNIFPPSLEMDRIYVSHFRSVGNYLLG